MNPSLRLRTKMAWAALRGRPVMHDIRVRGVVEVSDPRSVIVANHIEPPRREQAHV